MLVSSFSSTFSMSANDSVICKNLENKKLSRHDKLYYINCLLYSVVQILHA